MNVAIALAGIGLLFVTVERAGGWSAVIGGVTSVGWWFLAVVMIGAARMVCRACAWVACIREGQLRVRDAFVAVLAGDTAGNLTPLGVLASEPTKILMTRGRLSSVVSIASVAIENAFYTASVLVVLLTGTWVLLQRADVPPGLAQLSKVILGVVAIAMVIGVWASRTRPALLSRVAPVVARLAGRADAPADAIREVESRIYGVLQWPIGQILHVVSWEAAFHILAVAEVWLVLRLLPAANRVTLSDAFLMESAGRFVTIAFKFVPYRVGIDEVGSGAVAQVLGLGPATGVSLALIRRLRILVLNAAGLVGLIR
ncbi:MAG TPA: lysylphosphatidylglycerol synthase domain-containing protein [Vicinamibacterales bacterium]|nr:lysylphosphatidylglycerol synthase domain-containing protein [Vicinamibacterales bacterium]